MPDSAYRESDLIEEREIPETAFTPPGTVSYFLHFPFEHFSSLISFIQVPQCQIRLLQSWTQERNMLEALPDCLGMPFFCIFVLVYPFWDIS